VKLSRRQLLLASAAEPSDADLIGGLLDRELELEAAYAAALESGAIEPGLGERLLRHEREHVRGLEQVLRGRRPPPVDRPPLPVEGQREFARAALGLEGATVSAYAEALTVLRDERLLQPLGSIMACGAQHEVALRQLLGENLL
jgi:hypothetical protein